jgi:hypothetical protein
MNNQTNPDEIIPKDELIDKLIAFRKEVDISVQNAIAEGRIVETSDGVLIKGETYSIFLSKD